MVCSTHTGQCVNDYLFILAERCTLKMDNSWISGLYNGIGYIKGNDKQYENALEWDDKAIICSRIWESQSSLAERLRNIGNTLRNDGHGDSARLAYNKAMGIAGMVGSTDNNNNNNNK